MAERSVRWSLLLAAVAAVGGLTIPLTARAAELRWDSDGVFGNGSLGGSGTWDTTSALWDDGAADTTWTTNTIAGDTARFDGAAGTVTLGGAINALGLAFSTAGYTISGANTLALGAGGIDAGTLTGGTTTIGTTTLNIGAAQAWNVGSGSTLGVSSLLTGTTRLSKSGGGTLNLSGTSTGFTGGLSVTGGIANLTGQLSAGSNQAAVGVEVNAASGQTAIFNTSGTIGAGGTITSPASFVVGNTAGGTGIFNMTGGFIRTQASGSSPAAREFHVGRNGFGVANVSGGTMDLYGYLVGGIANSGATGVWNISGGTVSVRSKGNSNFAGTLGATAGTTGVMTVTGTGTFNSVGLFDNGSAGTSATPGLYVGESGTGVLNVSGGGKVNLGAIATGNGLVIGRNNVATASGVVNLGTNGTIATTRVQKPGAAATGYLNFHGGTLQARTGVANAAFMSGLTGAFVYGEGGTIDNNAQSITIGQALLAPAGQGASAISTAGLDATGYSAAPLVTISGGSGKGMTANAVIDGGGNLTGFAITNPGSGYAASDTITVVLSGGGKATTSSSTSAVALANNVSGGLIFTGTGTTTLTAANTYTGMTTIAGGTLALGATGSLSSGLVDVKAGATLDATAQSFTMQTMSFTLDSDANGGAGAAGLLKAGVLNIDNGVANFATVGTLNDPAYVIATYSSLGGSTMRLASVSGLPSGWGIDYAYNGNSIAVVIPEPATASLAVIVASMAMLSRRRRCA